MDVVTIYLAKALICFAGHCHPALLGKDTHPGEYQMQVLYTQQRGYGGDVLEYDGDDTQWFAIHRTYVGGKRDRSKLYDLPAAQRRYVSAGCVNVQPHVYEQLKDCCSQQPLRIVP